MKQRNWLIFTLASISAAVAIILFYFAFRGSQTPELSPSAREVIVVHDNLVQNRIQMIELVALDFDDPDAQFEASELLGHIGAQNEAGVKLIESPEAIENISGDLLSQTGDYLDGQARFVEQAQTQNSADFDEATRLLAQLTNLILEYRVALKAQGVELPQLLPARQ